MNLCFATNNPNKLREIRSMLDDSIQLLALKETGFNEELSETGSTLRDNAYEKASQVYQATGVNCFSDDTGLEVDALNGAPGVYSARYAGADKNPEANMALLLENMQGVNNRKARFRTVIALIIDGECRFFEGKADGRILTEPKGQKGFGYDPVFAPEGYETSFSEMDQEEKNRISHRKVAFDQLISFLNSAN